MIAGSTSLNCSARGSALIAVTSAVVLVRLHSGAGVTSD